MKLLILIVVVLFVMFLKEEFVTQQYVPCPTVTPAENYKYTKQCNNWNKRWIYKNFRTYRCWISSCLKRKSIKSSVGI